MEYSGGCWILGRYGSKQRNLSHSSSYPDFQPESFTARQKITKRPGTDASLYWLPKEIAEMPRLEAPGPRRDDGVDRHPRLRNNAGTGASGPESEPESRASGTIPIQILPLTNTPFPQELLAISIIILRFEKLALPLAGIDLALLGVTEHKTHMNEQLRNVDSS